MQPCPELQAPERKPCKRPDRSKKLLERRKQIEYVIKASLKGSLQGSEDERNALQTIFKLWSDSYSQRVNFASRALTLLLKECFDGCKDFKNVRIPNILDQTFIRQMMLGTEDAVKPIKTVASFFERYPTLLKQSERFRGDRNIYSDGCNEYLTNLKVSLSFIFESRLKKYFKYVMSSKEWEGETVRFMLFQILGDYLPEDIKEMQLEVKHPEILEVVKEVRSILNIENEQYANEEWLKQPENLTQVLKLYAFILSRLPKDKYFNLIPLTRVRNHFITLDKSCFVQIFKRVGILDKKANESLLTQEFFESVFKFPKKQRFTGTVDTDGRSVCFHFQRPKPIFDKEKEKQRIERNLTLFDKEGVRKLGCDPGRANIYTIIEEGTTKSWSLSRNQYYSEAGVFESRKKAKYWLETIKENLDALSKVSSKGISLDSYKAYLEVFQNNYQAIWDECSKPYWADQRLRLYGGKKRCFDRFWNSVLGPENQRKETVIAFGGAKMSPGGKGEKSVPTTRAFKECKKQRGLHIVVVDEFRTSKICHKTQTLLQLVKVQGEEHSLRGLLWCCSTKDSKQGFFVNRDVNAAWNILKCVRNRPEIFQRKPSKRLNKQKVEKVIKNPLYKPETGSLGDCKEAEKAYMKKANDDVAFF